MRIYHNIPALNSNNQLYKNNVKTSKVMEKLASGLRINHASDDAAGLAISEKMKSQIRGLSQAERNVLDGISIIQIADGGLNWIQEMLQRMRVLAVQSSNGTLSDRDREQIQHEIVQLKNGIDETAANTTYNTIHLLDGSNPQITDTGSSGSPYNFENVLSIPPVDANGLFLFKTNEGYPTTDMDNNETLVYGSGNTSYPSVRIDGKSYTLHNGSPNVTVPEPTFEQNGKYVTVYNVKDGDADVNITQTVNVVKDKYQIAYSIENNSVTSQQIGFLFNIDTMLGTDDQAPFIIKGSSVNTETKYTGSDIPDSFIVYNHDGTNPDLQAYGIIKGAEDFPIVAEPDAFGIGQWTKVDKWDWFPSTSYTDSAYSIWWNERTIQPGNSFDLNTYYGLAVPPTIDDPTKNSQDGAFDLTLQVGPNKGHEFKIQLSDVRTNSLGLQDLSTRSQNDAEQAIQKVDEAIEKVSTERSRWGSYQNALEYTHSNLSNASENVTSAESQIADTDMAREMAEIMKMNILNQTAQAMISQANQLPQGILQLLKE